MKFLQNRLHRSAAFVALAVAILANNGNPPTGKTGAPFDGNCGECHSPNMAFNGTVAVSGLPGTIAPNTVYNLTMTCNVTAGSPIKAGYQMVVVQNNNTNAGNLAATDTESGTEMSGSREYIEQRNGKAFSGGTVSWDFEWTSPPSSNGNVVKFYYIGNFTNANGNSSGDRAIASTITLPFAGAAPVTAAITSTTNVLCNGGSTGSATAAGGGGTPPYTYAWSNGQTDETAVNLAAGNYSVTVKDANLVSAIATANITQPAAITASISAPGTITCTNLSITATATAGGGVGGFSYAWSNGDSGNPISVTTPGSLTVSVTDGNGCLKTATVTVAGNIAEPTAVANANTDITCSTPTAIVSGAGSSTGANFTYLWSGTGIVSGGTTLNATVNQPGNFTLQVTNTANGCTSTEVATVISTATPPSATATGGSVSCQFPTTTVTVATNAPNATFSWTGPGGFTSNLQTPTVGQTGIYNVTVTNTANDCTASASATVTGNIAQPTATATGAGLTCGNPSAQIFSATNASNPGFSWTGPNGFTSTQQNPTVNAVGTYTVVITNPVNGCTNSATATVTQDVAQPSASATSATLSCAMPSGQISASSNVPAATFFWSGPGINAGNQNQQSPTVSVAGNYSVVVTNPANGCTNSASSIVSINNAAPGASAVGGTVTCSTNSVVLMGNSPTGTVNYSWTGPNGFTSNQQNPTASTVGNYALVVTNPANGCTSEATAVLGQNTVAPTASAATPGQLSCNATSIQINATASSQGSEFAYSWTTADGNILSGAATLSPIVNQIGTYNLLITNGLNGCTATTSVNVSAIPAVTSGISNTQNVGCNGGANGSATVSAGGGTGNFSYTWSNGQTTATASNLTAGSYSVTAQDATGGCTTTASATISQPDVLAANASATPVTFNGGTDGTASAAPTGGTSVFNYLWTNGSTAQNISGLAPGIYSVVVTDANGCTAGQTVTVNSFGCLIAATGGATNVTCFGAANGTATATVSGANLPVSYLWSNGGTSADISGLEPGDYSCAILDANGCPATISVNITQPTALAANASSTHVTANGATDGTASAQPAGGSPIYTFLWNTGQTSQNISGLAPGNYTVSVTDANSCTATQTVTVNAFNCVFGATVNTVSITCFGAANGQATALSTGGTAPFGYLWSNGQTTSTATNLPPGNGTVSVTDAAGCATTADFSIAQPTAFVPATATIANNVCPENQNGEIKINLSGGTPNYTYLWSNGQITNPAVNLAVGQYSATVTDANGCTHTETNAVTATDNVPPTISCPANVSGCEGLPVVEEATGPVFADNCSFGNIQPVRTGAWANDHIYPVGTTVLGYSITDVLGNVANCNFNIVIHPKPGITVDASQNDVGNAGVGSISVTLANGPFASIIWNKNGLFFSNNEDLTGLSAGVYTLTLTSPAGCVNTSASITIMNTVGTESPAAQSLRILPNPTADILRIETDAVVSEIRLTDSRGRQVFSQKSDLREIDLSAFSEGVYFLQIRLADGSVVSRRVVRI